MSKPSNATKQGSRPVRHEAAAICTPGLEPIVEGELKALGMKPKPGSRGVVEFRANNRQLYAANVWLRTASRVLVRVASFRATDFAHLQDHADRIDWGQWIPKTHRAEFRVTASKSKLYHTDAIAQRLHQVVGPPALDEPTQPFVVRIDRDQVTVSVDASGTPLHRRPWRSDIGVAPLRPTMAAAILLASDWTPELPLLDPFCGSGTIPIEAALIARGLPPGGDRTFAFQHWKGFEPGAWASVNAAAKADVAAKTAIADAGAESAGEPIIAAADRDQAAVDAATANAERAGVADLVSISQAVVSDIAPATGAGAVVTNPPYGKRVGDGDLRPLYQRFGTVLREQRPEWMLTVVAADRRLASQIDRRLKPHAAFGHGGLRVQVLSRRGGKPAEPDPVPEARAPEASPPNS